MTKGKEELGGTRRCVERVFEAGRCAMVCCRLEAGQAGAGGELARVAFMLQSTTFFFYFYLFYSNIIYFTVPEVHSILPVSNSLSHHGSP